MIVPNAFMSVFKFSFKISCINSVSFIALRVSSTMLCNGLSFFLIIEIFLGLQNTKIGIPDFENLL